MEQVQFNDEMVYVELVADVPEKNDCRAYTNVVWVGKGDVKAYPKRLWPRLAPHPDVWRLVEKADPPPPVDLSPSADATQTAESLNAMSDDDVRALGAARGYKFHPRMLPTTLRIAFLAAQNAPEAAK